MRLNLPFRSRAAAPATLLTAMPEADPALPISPLEELRRSVIACLLWNEGCSERGVSVAEQIQRLVPLCAPADVAALAIEARERTHLRHVPLLLVRELVRHPAHPPVAGTLARIIHRPDELSEFLALYWV